MLLLDVEKLLETMVLDEFAVAAAAVIIRVSSMAEVESYVVLEKNAKLHIEK